ncbi:hypothetical protein ACOXXX_02495 [Thalassococcus sp. BH17M4-6]|uniref:hypothetical protein n=1 Tax=Thalassococcus sp. BH17M4-6 TaxID=3413148 RepID=UPI003BE55259
MFRVILASAAMLVAACDLVRDDLNSSGGVVGRGYSQHLFPAVTHAQRFDRYLLSLMVLAPVVLETSADAPQAAAAINRVNAAYRSLAELRQAAASCTVGAPAGGCALTPVDEGTPTAYAFESLAYDVQSDLYFLSKELIVNLDLDASAEDLAALNLTGLVGLVSRFRELFPIARRGAATYRDGVVLLADTVRRSCVATQAAGTDGSMTEAGKRACGRLQEQITARYGRGQDIGGPNDIQTLLYLARAAADGHAWAMTQAQRRAAIYHIDAACARAFDIQKIDNEENLLNCGTVAQNDNTPSRARVALWARL